MNNECVNEHVPGAIRRAGGKQAYQKQYQNLYYSNNADKIKQNHKQYRAENAEDIKKQVKQYQAENAEAIKQWKKTKHNCDVCGGEYTLSHKARHYKTKKHQKAIAEAVASHAPPPQTINNTINCQVCNLTQQK